jgi:hypothetical protein
MDLLGKLQLFPQQINQQLGNQLLTVAESL